VRPRTLIRESIRPSHEPRRFEQSIRFPDLLVNQSKRPTLELDLSAELVSTAFAERSAPRKLPLGSIQPSFSRAARLGQHTTLLLEKATVHLLFGRERRPLDLRSCVVPWPRRQGMLINGEFLDG
jgi:hypothetical protein